MPKHKPYQCNGGQCELVGGDRYGRCLLSVCDQQHSCHHPRTMRIEIEAGVILSAANAHIARLEMVSQG
jgi:hypothetical protein